MNHPALSLATALLLLAGTAHANTQDLLLNVRTQADLDARISATANAALKSALTEHKAAILAAAEARPHVEAVVRTIESAPGKFERVNTTPESLQKAAGGELSLFDSLKLVDLAMPNAGPHDHRKEDPYDAAFFEHLGHITELESLNIIATKLSDAWIAPLGRLNRLKTLRFTNNGKLTDEGLAQLANLSQLESFSFVGTAMTGQAFEKFPTWNQLMRASFRGSSINDEGLRFLCERLPNLENLSLAHAKFTNAGAPHLAKLTKLKGLEVGTRNATPECLAHLAKLPLEYLQLGDGLDASEGIALIKGIPSLRRLTLTNSKGLTDTDIKVVAGMRQLESLEFGSLEVSEERAALLQSFAFLKALRLAAKPQSYSAETQAKLKTLLPNTALKFE